MEGARILLLAGAGDTARAEALIGACDLAGARTRAVAPDGAVAALAPDAEVDVVVAACPLDSTSAASAPSSAAIFSSTGVTVGFE